MFLTTIRTTVVHVVVYAVQHIQFAAGPGPYLGPGLHLISRSSVDSWLEVPVNFGSTLRIYHHPSINGKKGIVKCTISILHHKYVVVILFQP